MRRISGSVSEETMGKIEGLVGRGVFPSKAELYRQAIQRFLREIEEAQKRRVEERKKAFREGKRKAKEKDGDEAEEIVRFADALF
jgi:Arc/MetJ-type ribon-helix-helix transcriptional regulator